MHLMIYKMIPGTSIMKGTMLNNNKTQIDFEKRGGKTIFWQLKHYSILESTGACSYIQCFSLQWIFWLEDSVFSNLPRAYPCWAEAKPLGMLCLSRAKVKDWLIDKIRFPFSHFTKLLYGSFHFHMGAWIQWDQDSHQPQWLVVWQSRKRHRVLDI